MVEGCWVTNNLNNKRKKQGCPGSGSAEDIFGAHGANGDGRGNGGLGPYAEKHVCMADSIRFIGGMNRACVWVAH